MIEVNNFKGIKVGLASPEQIRSWSSRSAPTALLRSPQSISDSYLLLFSKVIIIYYPRKYSALLFPVQTPCSPAGRFCLRAGRLAQLPGSFTSRACTGNHPQNDVCSCPARLQVALVQEIIRRTTFPCTSLADLADYPPDPGKLEQKTPVRYAIWCTSETCTSRHRLCPFSFRLIVLYLHR